MPIPTNWKFSASLFGAGGNLVLLVPAPDPQIRRVVTQAFARVQNSGAGLYQPAVQLLTGGSIRATWPLWTNAAAGFVDTSEISDDGPWTAELGETVTLQFNVASGANTVQFLLISGYDL